MKRILFAMVLLILTLTFKANASHFDWKIEDDTLVISGEGRMPDFEHSDFSPWGSRKLDIKHIQIGQGITHVGNHSFSGCVNAESADLPDTLESIGIQAFAYCANLACVALPDSVTELGYEAFYACISLKDVKLSQNLKSIPWSTFSVCEGLERVYIPDGVEFIDYYAFSGCRALKSVILGKSALGQDVFRGCVSLREVISDTGVTHTDSSIPIVYTDGMDNFRPVNSYSDLLFRDVLCVDWFRNNVEYVYNIGIMMGSGADIFEPYNYLTYAHAVTMAARVHSIYYTGKADFVQGEVWYQPYLDYCISNGLVNGVYDMTSYITRERFVEIINVLPEGELIPLSDLLPHDSDNPTVKLFYRAGILAGNDSENTFAPESFITRAEVSAVISRLINKEMRLSTH